MPAKWTVRQTHVHPTEISVGWADDNDAWLQGPPIEHSADERSGECVDYISALIRSYNEIKSIDPTLLPGVLMVEINVTGDDAFLATGTVVVRDALRAIDEAMKDALTADQESGS